jgi:hypothetical protein
MNIAGKFYHKEWRKSKIRFCRLSNKQMQNDENSYKSGNKALHSPKCATKKKGEKIATQPQILQIAAAVMLGEKAKAKILANDQD